MEKAYDCPYCPTTVLTEVGRTDPPACPYCGNTMTPAKR